MTNIAVATAENVSQDHAIVCPSTVAHVLPLHKSFVYRIQYDYPLQIKITLNFTSLCKYCAEHSLGEMSGPCYTLSTIMGACCFR